MNNEKFCKEIFFENIFISNGSIIDIINFESTTENKLISKLDPQIIIEFNDECQNFYFDCEYSSNINENNITVYFTNDEIGGIPQFTQIKSMTLQSQVKQIISLDEKMKYIRVDLGESEQIYNKLMVEIYPLDNQEKMETFLEKKLDSKKCEKKIVLVSHDLSETGAPILLLNIAKRMNNLGYQVIVITEAGGNLFNEFVRNDITCLIINGCFHNLKVKNNCKEFLYNLCFCLKKNDFNKVVLNTIITGNLVKLFKLNDFVCISLIHEMYNSITHYGFGGSGNNIKEYATKIIFPSLCVKEDFENLFGNIEDKYDIEPQGYFGNDKYEKNENCDIQQPYIIGMGSFSLRKGSDLFCLAAMNMVINGNKKFRFIWLGDISDTELYNWIYYQIKKSNLEQFFTFIPFSKKERYNNIVSNSSALWLTSREDPFPSVMLDAINLNVPVFAFQNSGGADELLKSERGVLIPNFDLNALVDQTEKLLNDKKTASKIVQNAKRYLEENLNFNDYIQYLLEI